MVRTSARLGKMSSSDCKAKKMPHALLIPLPAQGHINPMMQLAWKLVSDGFLITFLNTDVNQQRILKANKDKNMQSNCDKIRMISVPGGLPTEAVSGENQSNGASMFFEDTRKTLGPCVIDKVIREINDKYEDQKITCMIADVWTCFGLQTVAELHHITLAVLQTSLVSTFAIRYFGPKLVSLGLVPSDGVPKEDKIQQYLPSMPPLKSAHLPWLYGGEYMFHHGIQMGKESAKAEWILFNTFYELEPGVADDLSKEMGVHPIGPLIPPEFLEDERNISTMATPSFWEDDLECLEWLEKQQKESVIYVAFGSLATWNNRQVEELALGLEATQRPFLWVVRSDGANGVSTVLPSGYLERVKDRGFIVSWTPQLRVLSHPSISCFVSHCGWNSTLESITMGVPMLCWPYFADQFLNSAYVVHVWKVGLGFEANNDGLIEKGEISKVIERLIGTEEGKAIREGMKKLSGTAKAAVREGGSSSTNYKLFLDAVRK